MTIAYAWQNRSGSVTHIIKRPVPAFAPPMSIANSAGANALCGALPKEGWQNITAGEPVHQWRCQRCLDRSRT